MRPSRLVAGALAMGTALLAIARHRRRMGGGVEKPGGIVMGDASSYETLSRLLLGGFYRTVASDITASAARGGAVLEVGCGPGVLSIRLARDHGLDVTGMDLDPAMIERARANGERLPAGARLRFMVGDVAALPFDDGSFDVVFSTLSVHHWADPGAGLAEVARVLKPGGRALIWDIRPGAMPLHRSAPDPLAQMEGSALRVVRAAPWPWPWGLKLIQKIELAKP
jgi:ubiquinone/menaquinone biosynthesis C-methylase UbiE